MAATRRRAESLPVLIAAAEAACDPTFNLHGLACSTHFSAPLIIVNGPIRHRIGLTARSACSVPATGPTPPSGERCGY